MRRFQARQPVEFKDGLRWKPATIQRVAGELYLVATDDRFGEKEFFWEWVDASRLREPGEDFEGPAMRDQFGHKVGNDSLRDAQRAARSAYADYLAERGQDKPGQRDRRGGVGPRPGDQPGDRSALPIRAADRSSMGLIGFMERGWRPLGLVPGEAWKGRRFSVELKTQTGDAFESIEGVSARGKWGLATIRTGPPNEPAWYGEKLDLAAGRVRGVGGFGDSRPSAISPDGARAAGHSVGFGVGSSQRLDVWDWSGPKPTHGWSVEAFDRGDDRERDIVRVEWADAATVVAQSVGGELTAWDAETGRGLWRVRGTSPPGLAWAVGPTSADGGGV
ncbi:MAG: hypothetical protein AAFX76_11395, partial [Planctomycetota bacterium]